MTLPWRRSRLTRFVRVGGDGNERLRRAGKLDFNDELTCAAEAEAEARHTGFWEPEEDESPYGRDDYDPGPDY